MAFDCFLKIDGIEGPSTNIKHKGEIDVLSFSWGVSNSSSLVGGGGGAGKPKGSDFVVLKQNDMTSPELALLVCTGKQVDEVSLLVELTTSGKGGKGGEAFFKVTMKDCLISSFSVGGGSGAQPTEQVSFAYAQIRLEYSDGKKGSSQGLCDLVPEK